jgi:signal transduction histidine kinase
VRRRLVLAIAGVAATAVVLFAVPLALVLQRTYRDEALLRLQRDTISATRAIDPAAPAGDPIELPSSADALAVYARGGGRTAGDGPATADAVVREALATGRPSDRVAGGRLVVAVPLLDNERVAGVVRAERSGSGAADAAGRAWLLLLGAAAAIAVLAVLAAVVLGRRLAAPLERLAAAARRLGDGDFTTRAPRSGVAELDAVGAALDATAVRLGDLIARERAFSADASHQLRTPLAALRLEVEAMELRGESPEAVARAIAEVDRLQATIEVLLSVARDVPRGDARADLAALADEIEPRWRGMLAAAGRPLRIAVRAPEPVVRAAPAVLEQVLDVLLGNAVTHGAGAVSLTIRDADGWIAVDVADEGAGFAGDAEAAFVRRAGSGDGHGIGLALARALVHAERGRLVVTRAAPAPVLTVLLSRTSPGGGPG